MEDHSFYKSLIHLLTKGRVFCFFVDGQGKPISAFHQRTHANPNFFNRLLSNPISLNYLLPTHNHLHELFDPSTAIKKAHTEPLTALLQSLSADTTLPMLTFPSRNILEQGSDLYRFEVIYPVTTLKLIQLHQELYLATVSFQSVYHYILSYAHQTVVVTDSQLVIRGFSEPARIKFQLAAHNLGDPLTHHLRFDKAPESSPMHPSLSPEECHRYYTWQEPTDFAKWLFDPEQRGTIKSDQNGFTWTNNNPQTYRYLQFRESLNTAEEDFDLCLHYDGPEAPQFGVILEGTEIKAEKKRPRELPDEEGYTISFGISGPPAVVTFKRKTSPMASFSEPPFHYQRQRSLEIRKRGQTFQIHLNGVYQGEWVETFFQPLAEANHLYLFLRPSSSIKIRKITFCKSHLTEPSHTSAPNRLLTGQPIRGNSHFLIHRQSSLWSDENVFIHFFEDITPLHESLQKLTQEKETLYTLLNPLGTPAGQSPKMAEFRAHLTKAAKTDLTVLLEGETGTGKEVAAKFLHDHSPRRKNPFIKVDCSSFPESLLEAELFGYEKGAFTGAAAAFAGRFEQAEGGTLFLDEIANISMSTQAKLLAVLQDLTIQRLGSAERKALNIRIIAASNIPTRLLMAEKRFRPDLFYRLQQVRLTLPPLRKRLEDLPLLAEEFLRESTLLYKKSITGFSADALRKLMDYPWPGNIRELRSTIFRAVLFCDSTLLEPDHLQFSDLPIETELSTMQEKEVAKEPLTKERFQEVCTKYNGNVRQMALALACSRPTIYRLIKEWGLHLSKFRKTAE